MAPSKEKRRTNSMAQGCDACKGHSRRKCQVGPLTVSRSEALLQILPTATNRRASPGESPVAEGHRAAASGPKVGQQLGPRLLGEGSRLLVGPMGHRERHRPRGETQHLLGGQDELYVMH